MKYSILLFLLSKHLLFEMFSSNTCLFGSKGVHRIKIKIKMSDFSVRKFMRSVHGGGGGGVGGGIRVWQVLR